MNKTRIVTFIESFIRRNLNFRYLPQLPVQLFCDEYISIENPQISGNSPVFQLIGNGFFGGRWHYLKYRFPQTRIYLHEFQNVNYRIQIIEFFDEIIIYLKNVSDQNQNKISLMHQPGVQIISSESLACQSAESAEIQLSTDALIWLSGNAKKRRLNQIPAFLNNAENSEKKIHPFNNTSALNAQLMREIDKLWAELNHIGPQREIDVQSVLDTDPADLIWIQEIYLHFGWYQELSRVYAYIKANIELLTEYNIRKILHAAYRRYCAISKRFGQDFLKFKFDFEAQKINNFEDTDFLNLYLNMGQGKAPDQLNNLWQRSVYMQLPVFNLAFARDVSQNPEAFIALTLLLFKEDFYRAPAVAEKLTEYLPENKGNMVKFLIAIKSIANLNFERQKTILGKHQTNSNLDRLNYIENYLQIKYIRHGERAFTELERKEGLYLKIDKTVNISITEQKHLEIEPVIYRPPVKKPDLCFIEIETGGSILSLPLIWKDFTLEINGVRLKFLLKKSRYQISVKFSRNADIVRIEQSQLRSDGGKYLKTYYKPEFIPDQAQIDIYDQYARRIGLFGPFIERIYLRGTAVNGRGLLKEKFRVFRGSSAKSTDIATNTPIAKPYMISQPNLDIKLTAEKTAAVDLHREQDNGLYHKLINTEAGMLVHKLVIYVEENLEDRCEQIKGLCFATLAFIPNIKPLRDIDWNQPDFVLIVANKTDFEISRAYPLFSIVKAADNRKSKAILVRDEDLQSFFSQENFMLY